jgi:hypothetical protein
MLPSTITIPACNLDLPLYPLQLQVLLRALRDFNLGKLTADDTGIFMGLLNDIFPKTLDSVPRAINRGFEAHVRHSLGRNTIQENFDKRDKTKHR